MDRGLLREATRLSDLHAPYALALIVGTEGSVPRERGGGMLLRSDGTFLGTVGGARLEEEVKAGLRKAFTEREGALRHYELRGWKAGGVPSRCGGSVDVAFEYVGGGPNVLIWGAGHVGRALGRALSLLEYDHTVADDRPEFLTRDRFPSARDLWAIEPANLSSRVRNEGHRFSHAYVLGYDCEKDEEVLTGLLGTVDGPIGLIASRTKRGLTLKALRKRGIEPQQLARIRSPVGLPIGAETPEEIALSIAAEVVRDSRGVP